MVKLRIEEIVKGGRKNFERTWEETAKLLPRDTHIVLPQGGTLHPLREATQRCRTILHEMGFSECENRTILPAEEVYLQYGPEAPVILDRAFYLAKLPRPEIGLSNERIGAVEEIIGSFNVDTLQEILRSYKKGEIEGDDFVESLVKGLGVSTAQATSIISNVFEELRNLAPQATNMTLRSHMTATWYHTLSALQDKRVHPLALFSVGPRYRNEQREDAGHLRVHHSTSMVILDPNMSLEAGREITVDFLKRLGFTDANFETKAATSKYYANKQEEEVFAQWGNKWLEIGDIGMYSPISLANFGIQYPVFNGGFGVERLAMILGGHEDIREMVFPQFHSKSYTDAQIFSALSLIHSPTTDKGRKIAQGIENIAREYRNESAPCRFEAYQDSEIKVEVVELETGQKLIGPAAFNEIYVSEGNLLSRLESGAEGWDQSYMRYASLGIAAQIEEGISAGREQDTLRVRNVKSLSDINLKLPTKVQDYLVGEHKRIQAKGPFFMTVEYTLKRD